MKVQQVLNCSFDFWYPTFKKTTIKSKILELPEDFVTYLLADGLVLPDSLEHKFSNRDKCGIDEDKDDEDDDNEVDWNAAETTTAEAPVFTELDGKIKECIAELGGSVFPKLNWSSPRDASWIAMNNCMKCRTVSDIYLLLKSSDFVMHDLTQPFKFCDDDTRQPGPVKHSDMANENGCTDFKYHLVLRKWTEIDPSTEYRCFIKDHKIIGICQRDHTNYYEHISHQKNDIVRDILSFFREHIYCKFPDSCYVIDVYRKTKDLVRLIDFNPFGAVTDSLLFDWDELREMSLSSPSEWPEFRYVTRNRGVQPSPYRCYGLPQDFVDLSTGEDPFKLLDILNLSMQTRHVETLDSDDEDHSRSS